MSDVVCLGLTESLHQQLRDLRLAVELRLAQSQLSLGLETNIGNIWYKFIEIYLYRPAPTLAGDRCHLSVIKQ